LKGFLADTNAISEYARPNPDPGVMVWFEQAAPETLFVSVITLGELTIGVENLPAGRRRSDLESWLAKGLPAWFAANLLPINGSIAHLWGRLTIQAKRAGTPLSMADGLIAATALEHDLTLVTRNVKDFAGLGVAVFNPWQPQA
jgi:predicted nucleic acid-binding protein